MSAQADVTFTPATSFSPGYGASAILVENVVGSALDDILFTNAAAGSLRILENLGPTAVPTSTDVAVGASPNAIVVGDFDGDGDVDIVTRGMTNTTVLLKQTSGYTRTDYPLSATGRVNVADVNDDGMKDLVRGTSAALATSPGAFGALTNLVTTTATVLDTIVADFDGDGRNDFLVLTATVPYTISVELYRGAAGGSFLATVTTTLPGAFVGAFAINDAELNADGRRDLACFGAFPYVSFYGGTPTLFSLIADPNGTFSLTAATAICFAESPTSIVGPIVEDFDGDGGVEAVVRFEYAPVGGLANAWQDIVAMSKVDALGRFYDLEVISSTYSSYSIGTQPGTRPMDLGDIDGDGDQDLVLRTGTPLPATNINIFLASSTSVMPSTATSMTILEGADLIGPPSANLIEPVRVRVTDSSGAPVAGVEVTIDRSFSNLVASVSPCLSQITNSLGEATFTIRTGTSLGSMTMAVFAGQLPPQTVTLDVRSLAVQKISGDNQTIAIAGNPPVPVSPPSPLVVVVYDTLSGNAVEGVGVEFFQSLGPSHFVLPQRMLSDASGVASLFLSPTVAAGAPGIVSVGIGTQASNVTFTETVIGPALSASGSAVQATDSGEGFPIPLEVLVLDYAGNPAAGIPVTFFTQLASNPITFGSPMPVFTDANGRASVVAQTTAAGGNFIVRASIPAGPTQPTFSLFARRLNMTGSAASGSLAVTYVHEDGPTPLVLAIDTAPPASPIATPYGTISTSILAPTESLLVSDPQGLLGLPDAGLVANPTFARTYSIPPWLAEFGFVTQIYGFDPTYYPDLTLAIFVSNAVTTTL